MTAAPNPSGHLHLDPTGRLDMDLPCVGCDYNLRGLLPDGACPECGKPVAYATRLLNLGQRDPLYLRRVAAGLSWLIAGAAAVAIAVCCAPVVVYGQGYPTFITRLDEVGMVFLIVGAVLTVIGTFLVTTPHEPMPGRPRLDQRWIARAGIVTGLAMLLFGMRFVWDIVGTMGGFIYWTACAVVSSVGFRAALRYGAKLAAQIEHPGLAFQARTVARLLAALAWIVVLCGVVWHLPSSFNTRLGINPILRVPQLLLFGLSVLFVLIVWSLVLLIWYRKRVLEAARLAEQLVPVGGMGQSSDPCAEQKKASALL